MNRQSNILVAGIGNIFFGDDAFGCETARVLAGRKLPENVRLVDFGIRSVDLVYALLEDHDLTILIDAMARGEKPGTLYIVEPDLDELRNQEATDLMIDTHGLNPMRVLSLAISMGATCKKLLLVACEPETFGGEEGHIGLSETVKIATEKAADIIESLIEKEIAKISIQ